MSYTSTCLPGNVDSFQNYVNTEQDYTCNCRLQNTFSDKNIQHIPKTNIIRTSIFTKSSRKHLFKLLKIWAWYKSLAAKVLFLHAPRIPYGHLC